MRSAKEDYNLDTPQRQSILGIVVYLVRNFRAMLSAMILLIALASSQPVFWLILATAALPVIIFIGVLAYYQYMNFTFHVSEDELIINKGVFFKERVVIDLDRIQSIQITENLIQRILKLVAIKVDTAGAKGSQLEIPALKEIHAKELRELIYFRKKALAQSTEIEDTYKPHTDEVEEDVNVQTLVRLSIWDLFIVGITENHLRTGFVALAFLYGTLNQYQPIVEKYFDETFDEFAAEAVNAGLAIVLILIVVYIVFSILLSIIRTFLRFYGMEAVLKRKSVDISTGLIKREKYSIPDRKVQFIRFESNPLRRAVGYESAKIRPSSSVEDDARNQRIEIPALRKADVNQLTKGVFENYEKPQFALIGNKWGYARLWFNISLAILIVAATGLYFEFGYKSFLILIAAVLMGTLGYFYGKTIRIFYNLDFVVIQKGWFFINRTVFPTYKIQGVKYRQPVFLEPHELCHLSFFTAAGVNSVRYLKQNEAMEMYNLMIYCVESNNKPWM